MVVATAEEVGVEGYMIIRPLNILGVQGYKIITLLTQGSFPAQNSFVWTSNIDRCTSYPLHYNPKPLDI